MSLNTPVAVTATKNGDVAVVCSNGAVFALIDEDHLDTIQWSELVPIPGSLRDMEQRRGLAGVQLGQDAQANR